MSGILRDDALYLKDANGVYSNLGQLFTTLEVHDTHLLIELPNGTQFNLIRKPDTPDSHLPLNAKCGRVNRLHVERQVLTVVFDSGVRGYIPSVSLSGCSPQKPKCVPRHTLMPKLSQCNPLSMYKKPPCSPCNTPPSKCPPKPCPPKQYRPPCPPKPCPPQYKGACPPKPCPPQYKPCDPCPPKYNCPQYNKPPCPPKCPPKPCPPKPCPPKPCPPKCTPKPCTKPPVSVSSECDSYVPEPLRYRNCNSTTTDLPVLTHADVDQDGSMGLLPVTLEKGNVI